MRLRENTQSEIFDILVSQGICKVDAVYLAKHIAGCDITLQRQLARAMKIISMGTADNRF